MFFKILFIILAYLIGSIPFGFLFGKMKGIDIRTVGSKNIGATNTGRILGKKYAVLTYLLDMLKGAIFVVLFRFSILPHEWCVLSPMLYGFIAVVGHTFPIYLKFKGGKSVACSSGAVCGYFPLLLPLLLISFTIVKKISKLVSLASLISTFVAFIAILILSLATHQFLYAIDGVFYNPDYNFWPFNMWYVIFAFCCSFIIFIRHSSNIKRIINHTENPSGY